MEREAATKRMYERSVLDNGLKVITSSMPHSRSVSVAVLVGAGSCYEDEEEAGISHFAEHVFFKGTRRRPTAGDISREIEGVGGVINASTDKEVTTFWCKVAAAHFRLALDVLSDVVLESRFDEAEIEKERQVVLEEIKMNLDLPQHRVGSLVEELLWPGQPLGRDIAGYKETVVTTERGRLLDYVGRRYVPNNTVVSVAGAVEHEEAVREVESLWGRWGPRDVSNGYESQSVQHGPQVRSELKEGQQAHLCLAVHGFSRFDPRRFALGLLNTVLGGGMSSRLFTEIRENQGLAYDIHSYVETFRYSGSFVTYAGVDPGKLRVAVEAILKELSKVRGGVPDDELFRAKEHSKGQLQLRLEDSHRVALWLGGQELLRGQILDVDEVLSIIDSISAQELAQVAEEVLQSQRLNLAVVAPQGDAASVAWLRL
ncbi:MAG: M16 family metallopeptidase [Chloroflexota bacterium]